MTLFVILLCGYLGNRGAKALLIASPAVNTARETHAGWLQPAWTIVNYLKLDKGRNGYTKLDNPAWPGLPGETITRL